MPDKRAMQHLARGKLTESGLLTLQNINQTVETLSGGQRQGVAVARAAASGSRIVIMDEPTAVLAKFPDIHLLSDELKRAYRCQRKRKDPERRTLSGS